MGHGGFAPHWRQNTTLGSVVATALGTPIWQPSDFGKPNIPVAGPQQTMSNPNVESSESAWAIVRPVAMRYCFEIFDN